MPSASLSSAGLVGPPVRSLARHRRASTDIQPLGYVDEVLAVSVSIDSAGGIDRPVMPARSTTLRAASACPSPSNEQRANRLDGVGHQSGVGVVLAVEVLARPRRHRLPVAGHKHRITRG